MAKRSFHVKAIWDDEAKAFYADSDIIGLHIEAGSVDEFERLMMDLAPELIVENHLSAVEIATTPYRELLPAIFWQRPEETSAHA